MWSCHLPKVLGDHNRKPGEGEQIIESKHQWLQLDSSDSSCYCWGDHIEDVEGEHVSEEERVKDKATSAIANFTDQILHLL